MHPDAPRSTLTRQHRVRLLQAVEQSTRQFRTRPEIWPLRVPAAPIVFDALATRALGARVDPFALRSRTLLRLEWPSGDTWELWVIALPSGMKIYCDTSGGETRMLATGRRDSEIETDRLFLELLAESAGEHFGIEMAGGAPSKVRIGVDRALAVEFFVALFEEASLVHEIRETIGQHADDFHADVDAWLSTRLR
jgi:hypothetical protein